MNTFGSLLGITASAAVAVVIATTVLYITLGLVLRLLGPRLGAGASTATVALLTLMGGIAARATLGETPTLTGGLLALATLVVLERISWRWWATQRESRTWSRSPVILMIGTRTRRQALRRYGISEEALRSLLRQGGIGHLDQVAVAVLEPRGALSILRAGQPLQPEMLAGVEGVEEIPSEMFGP